MIINDEQRIQISRSKHIEESRAIAVLRLNKKEFLPGEICMLNYYKEPDIRTSIGVLIAIGIKKGQGEDCYRIFSAGGTVPVRSIVTSLPDVSSLVHNELYIYKDEKLEWYYVYKDPSGPNRVIEKITGGPFIFLDLETGYRWFYRNQVCDREDEFFSSESTKRLLQAFVNSDLKINIFSKIGNIFEVGSVVDIPLEIIAENKKGENVNEKCRFYLNGVEITLDKNNVYTLKHQTVDNIINIEARFDLGENIWVSFYGTIETKFGYKFYFGRVSSNWEPSIDNIIKLENSIINYRRDYLWENINLTDQKLVYAYPSKYGNLQHIFDIHGIDYINTYQSYDLDFKIDGINYTYYILNNSISIKEFKQTFTFKDSDSLLLEENNILNLLTAWKYNNGPNGIVLLDETGRIPSEICKIDSSNLFQEIKSFINYYPSEGMIPGELYYNTIENKLFLATSNNNGIIIQPKPHTLYIYGIEFYSWSGVSLQPFGRIRSRKINNIKELYG